MNHTPGPWIFCGDHVDDSMGITLFRNTRTFENLNPLDIRLAAAAPDLLEACERVLRAEEWAVTEDRLDSAERVAILRAAIAKAQAD
uniref:Uncharacterized protein n=1 Tax=viral metagenome TaxID=1070528 RepID=A0A6M3Y5G2_9ZZZZ